MSSLPRPTPTPAALAALAAFHASTVAEVAAAVGRDPVVVVGMGWNPFVKKARKLLDGAGVAYTYLGYGNYLSQWKPRLAIKIWAGWPTFPQVFVQGRLVGGAKELKELLDAGALKGMIDAGR